MKRAIAVLAGVVAFGFGCLAYSYLTLPDVRSLATTNPKTTAFMDIRDREARARGKEPRRIQQWVGYARISPHVKKAVLVAEDAAFWDHDGVDYVELQKSIETDWARGQLSRGASTITQQLAKNLYLSPSRNPLRKLRELIIARRLEGALKKARIFELYLNLIEWGDGIYGIEAAAREYFGRSAATLGPSDAALLAGAIINPRLLTPNRPTARLLRRQQIILSRMGRVVPPAESLSEREPEKAPPYSFGRGRSESIIGTPRTEEPAEKSTRDGVVAPVEDIPSPEVARPDPVERAGPGPIIPPQTRNVPVRPFAEENHAAQLDSPTPASA